MATWSKSLLTRGLAVFALSLVPIPTTLAQDMAGSVKIAQGSTFIRRGAETLPAREGMHLFAQDGLSTAADGRLGVILQDGTRISLGPNTELKIDRFVYQPAQGQFALLLNLAKGVIAYFSGKIAEFSSGAVRLETPVGVIGLRGTKFAAAIESPKEAAQ